MIGVGETGFRAIKGPQAAAVVARPPQFPVSIETANENSAAAAYTPRAGVIGAAEAYHEARAAADGIGIVDGGAGALRVNREKGLMWVGSGFGFGSELRGRGQGYG